MDQGFLGGLLGGLGQQQQNMWQHQWQLANTSNASSAGVTNQYVVSYEPVVPVAAKSPHEETAVEWLDRRVTEVCLAL